MQSTDEGKTPAKGCGSQAKKSGSSRLTSSAKASDSSKFTSSGVGDRAGAAGDSGAYELARFRECR